MISVFLFYSYNRFLFFPNGINGLDLHGSPGRNQSGHQTTDQQDSSGYQGCLYIDTGVQQDDLLSRLQLGGKELIDQIHDEHTGAETQQTRQRGQYQAFAHHLRDDVEGLGADGSSDTDLLGTLLDRHHHDVADADDTGQQGTHTDQPDQEINAGKEHLEGLELGRYIDDAQCLRIGRGNLVLLVDDALDILSHPIDG